MVSIDRGCTAERESDGHVAGEEGDDVWISVRSPEGNQAGMDWKDEDTIQVSVL